MAEERIAVISDVHGNRWALEAVLQDIERRDVGSVVNLGDTVYGPLDPAGTARILLQLALPTVRGNEDRLILQRADELKDSPTLGYVREALTSEHLRWLETLPMTRVAHGHFRMCHGSPTRDDEYSLWKVCDAGLERRSSVELAAMLPAFAEPVFLCGHDHLPRTIRLGDGRLIVNPGSVGLPAYTDDAPVPHAMEAGTPHSRYAVMSMGAEGWQVESVAVPYDWEAAAAAALSNGRPDWADWLRTGRAGPMDTGRTSR